MSQHSRLIGQNRAYASDPRSNLYVPGTAESHNADQLLFGLLRNFTPQDAIERQGSAKQSIRDTNV